MSHQWRSSYKSNWYRGTSHLGNTKSEVKSKFDHSSEGNNEYFLSSTWSIWAMFSLNRECSIGIS